MSSLLTPDAALVTQLIREQAPQFAHLPVRASRTSGSSNDVFRLGDELAVRLPKTDAHAAELCTEVQFLPRFQKHLTTPIPRLTFSGAASETFPHEWAIVSWVAGVNPSALDAAQQVNLARSLGEFTRELHAIDASDQPCGKDHWGYRCGSPVNEEIGLWVEEAAVELNDLFDPAKVRAVWKRLQDVAPYDGPGVFVHTDLSAENVLVHTDGSLAGVIDFGAMGVGDPSIDLLYAWDLFDAPAGQIFKEVSAADDAAWARARTWAFGGPGVVTLAGYRTSMPARTARLTRMVEAIATDLDMSLR